MRMKRSFISSKYISMLCSGTVLMVLTAVMGIVDALVAGILLGEDAVAGVCLVLPVSSLTSFFAVCFSYGVPILYARKTGTFRQEEADQCFGVGLTVISCVGMVLFALILFFGNAYLKSYEASGPVYEHAREYLSWTKYAVLLLPLNELMDGMLFADGDEKTSLAANLAQGIVKVVLSVILCRQIGVKGLALASFISFAVSILISCLHFFRPGNTLKPNLAFSTKVFREILKFGVVDGSTFLFTSLFVTAIDFFVIRRFGPETLILVSVITLVREGQILFEGIGEAITPLISVYLGEENYPGVRKVWKYAHRTVWIESLLCTAFLLAGAPWIVDLLGIRDTATAGEAVRGLRILSLTLIFSCRLFLDSSYFILADRISLGVFDSFLRDMFPSILLAVIGGLIGGVFGMFVGLAVAPVLGYALSVLYIRRKYGTENYALFLAEAEKRKRTEVFEFEVLPGSIAEVRDEIGTVLRGCQVPEEQCNRVMLVFEELFMLIYDCNPGKTVLAECAVDLGESIRLNTKDNGRIVDLTITDRKVDSLRSYTLSNLLETRTTQRFHYLALSYNHNTIEIR